MKPISTASLADGLERIVTTSAAADETVCAPRDANVGAYSDAWQELIDYTLLEWACQSTRETFTEEELIPPTRASIQTAIKIASALRHEDSSPPDRIVPSGDGGIVLHWGELDGFSLQVFDQTVTLLSFNEGRITDRREI